MASSPQPSTPPSSPSSTRPARSLSLAWILPLAALWFVSLDQVSDSDSTSRSGSTNSRISEGSLDAPHGEGEEYTPSESLSPPDQARLIFPILEDSSQQDTTRVRSDTLQVDSTKVDSLLIHSPSESAAQDTIELVAIDSTARVKHFTYIRTDYPQVPLNVTRTHPLFLKNSYTRRSMAIDSMGSRVLIRELLFGKDVRIPISIGMEEYIRLRLEARQRAGWEAIARRYQLKEAESDDLQALLGDITNIDIPIPANPLFSIFGPPKINLRISGAVDIRAAFRNSKSDQTVISRLGNVRNEPDFNQEVQILVSGTVGDKLNINADWNTQRTFEYENQLKIKYTGYDDEIVRNVEAGNVSLPTPSGFVGSSQALFGIKSQFQMGPLTLTALASQKRGQVKEFSISGGAREQEFKKRAYDYSTNHYFVDVSYRDLFRDYYINPVPIIDFAKRITDIEVWVTRIGIEVPEERSVIAYIDLAPVGEGERYPDNIRDGSQIPGQVE
ncbi:MAG: cell surface protein SprA, partial [Bacteroidota bacterium]